MTIRRRLLPLLILGTAACAAPAPLPPAPADEFWTLEVDRDGRRFIYALRRGGTDRRFRVEFDMSREVPAPPPPWGL